MKMPKTIYVKIESESNGGEYLVANSRPSELIEAGDRVKIGVYRLVEVKTGVGETKLI